MYNIGGTRCNLITSYCTVYNTHTHTHDITTALHSPPHPTLLTFASDTPDDSQGMLLAAPSETTGAGPPSMLMTLLTGPWVTDAHLRFIQTYKGDLQQMVQAHPAHPPVRQRLNKDHHLLLTHTLHLYRRTQYMYMLYTLYTCISYAIV